MSSYSFGPFVLDPVKRVLRRDGSLVPMTSKTFDVLLTLIEQRGRLVGKDELLTRVWPGTVVQENNLVRQVSMLRRALDQRLDQHDYIVTIPGQGYSFVATVAEVEVADSPAVATHIGHVRAAPAIPSLPPGETLPSMKWWQRAGWRAVAAAATMLVAAAVVVLLIWSRRPPPSSSAHRTVQRITYDDSGLSRQSSWSPDGAWIVFASDRSGNADIWKQRLDDPNPVRLTDSEEAESDPAWSPDGRLIAFRSEQSGGGLYVVAANGGVPRRIANFGHEPRWSRDGSRILLNRSAVLQGSTTLYTVGLDGKAPRPVRPDLLADLTSLYAAWYPAAQHISIWGVTRNGTRTFLKVRLDGGAPAVTVIAEKVQQGLNGIAPGRFVWSPSRTRIYFEGRAGDVRNIWRVTVDPQTEEWVDGPERLTTGAGEDTDLALSPDGTRLLFTTRSTQNRLWAFPFDGGRITGEARPITSGGSGEVDVDTPPDGSKLAYRASRAGRSELWERSVSDAKERLLLASDQWRHTKPRWSPDGVRLSYARFDKTSRSRSAVVVLNIDGSGEHVLTRPGDVEFVPWDWSKDATALLGACRFSESERFAVCLMPVSSSLQVGGPTIRVIASDPKRDLFCQRFSPDQKWISVLALDPTDVSTSVVYVIPAAGGRWIAMTEGTTFDDKPRWSVDGATLYFVSHRTGVPNVWGRRFDPSSGSPSGLPFPVTDFRTAQFRLTPRTAEMDIALTPTQLLLPISESRGDVWMIDQVDR